VAYDGLPQNLADAGQRRAERLVVERVPRDASVAARPPRLEVSARTDSTCATCPDTAALRRTQLASSRLITH